jgi:large subunit ribosomal protein L15
MLNIIKDNQGARYKSKRLGRGIGSGKGKTSARGGKGQTARTGVAINGFEGGQTPLQRRLPKRGFSSLNKEIFEVVNFESIEKFIESGKLSKQITIKDLRTVGLLQGITAKVKLLGTGEVKNKFSIQVHAVSNKAKELAEKAGITVEIVKFERSLMPAKSEPKEKKEAAPVKKSAPKKAEATEAKEEKKVVAKKAPAKKATTKKTEKKK